MLVMGSFIILELSSHCLTWTWLCVSVNPSRSSSKYSDQKAANGLVCAYKEFNITLQFNTHYKKWLLRLHQSVYLYTVILYKHRCLELLWD